ncbi:carboxymuconolactone decarboxylase family protein [Vibrio agarivorans]|uniref:carboxymuconolactone decarboxylase family protein n=1 Tax=Vibrio agarivorans TaxID=153622 RepID=UPI00222EB8E1|nr:carboxymuconolactone decarboxylase family protein [Vibrio agarivorans]MDN3659716.1 carboxymuconolactone decarboxylase family protein [Vibrio agarivorans]
MLGKHTDSYSQFYSSTHDNEHLDSKTELLVGLSAAMAMNCLPCTHYYLKQAKKAGITKGEISDVTAKVMAVSAGQKKLQMQEVLQRYKIDLDTYV